MHLDPDLITRLTMIFHIDNEGMVANWFRILKIVWIKVGCFSTERRPTEIVGIT